MSGPRLFDAASLLAAAGVSVGFASAWLIGSGSLGMTPETIAQLGTTTMDFNPPVIAALSKQAAEGQAGAFLLVISATCQSLALYLALARRTQPKAAQLASLVAGGIAGVVVFVAADRWAGQQGASIAARALGIARATQETTIRQK